MAEHSEVCPTSSAPSPDTQVKVKVSVSSQVGHKVALRTPHAATEMRPRCLLAQVLLLVRRQVDRAQLQIAYRARRAYRPLRLKPSKATVDTRLK